MASTAMPADEGKRRQARNRFDRNPWMLLTLLVLVALLGIVAAGYWAYTRSPSKGVDRVEQSQGVVVEPGGTSVDKYAHMYGGPMDQPKVVYSPAGEASHAVYPVFYGTDRLRVTQWAGISVGALVSLGIAWLIALAAALLFWYRTTPGLVRKLAWVACVVSFGIGAFQVVGFFPLKEYAAAGRVYGSDRADLQLGMCTVSIPFDHQVGQLETPSLLHFEFREDPSKHVVLLRVDPMSSDQFAKELKAMADQVTRREALVVIHGYSNSFEDAARRAAQVAHDIGFQGVPAFYSWPSEGAWEAYNWDSQSVRNTVPHLQQFLETLAKEGNLTAIHVVAHSMGNRCATEAIRRGVSLGNCKLDRCILAAPDVDRKEFEDDIGKEVIKRVGQLTLYASANDKALLASHGANKFTRLGDARDGISVLDGMESVDATALETNYLSHDYFGSNANMIRELRQVIHERKPVNGRIGMHSVVATALLRYWRFQPPP